MADRKAWQRPIEMGKCEHCYPPNIKAALYTAEETADGRPHWICSNIECQAFLTWGPDLWRGRARMAHARRAAGLDLNHVDKAAIGRYPNDDDHYMVVDLAAVPLWRPDDGPARLHPPRPDDMEPSGTPLPDEPDSTLGWPDTG